MYFSFCDGLRLVGTGFLCVVSASLHIVCYFLGHLREPIWFFQAMLEVH